MSDKESLPSVTLHERFPTRDVPAIFADGVSSIANSAALVKFYLYRTDPSTTGDGGTNNTITSQVVMPLDGFVATFIFFETAIRRYVEQGLVHEKQMNDLRGIIEKMPWNDQK